MESQPNQPQQPESGEKLIDELPTFIAPAAATNSDQTRYDLDLANFTTFKVGGEDRQSQQQTEPTPKPKSEDALDISNPDSFVIGKPSSENFVDLEFDLDPPVNTDAPVITDSFITTSASDKQPAEVTTTKDNSLNDDVSSIEMHSEQSAEPKNTLANESLANVTNFINTSTIDGLLSDLPEESDEESTPSVVQSSAVLAAVDKQPAEVTPSKTNQLDDNVLSTEKHSEQTNENSEEPKMTLANESLVNGSTFINTSAIEGQLFNLPEETDKESTLPVVQPSAAADKLQPAEEVTSSKTNPLDDEVLSTEVDNEPTNEKINEPKMTLSDESLANGTNFINTSSTEGLLYDLPEETGKESTPPVVVQSLLTETQAVAATATEAASARETTAAAEATAERATAAASAAAAEPNTRLLAQPEQSVSLSQSSSAPDTASAPLSTTTTSAATTNIMGRKNQSYRRENSSDEAECSGSDQVKEYIENVLGPNAAELVYWRDVKNSGIVFGSGLVILLSLSIFSVISVVAYTLLFTLLGTLSFRIYKNVMQAVHKTDDGHPFKEYLEIEIAPPQERIHEIVDSVVAHGTCFINRMRSVLLVEDIVDSLKYLLIFWALTYIGACFNGMTLILLAYLGAFSLPKVYELNKVQIDQYLDLANSKIAEISDKVPFLKKVPTEKKEE